MIEREEVEAQAQALDALAEMPLEGENTDPFIEVMRLCGHQTATMLRTLLAERDAAFKTGEDAVGEWQPIAEADTSREIIAIAIDGSVYRMDTHQNHRGEICWQTWMNAGFADGYITHFVYLPTPPKDRHG